MSARATTLAQGFSQKLLLEMYDKSLVEVICNRDYQGEINNVGSVLNILAIERVSEKTYTGANLTPDSLYEKNAVLTIDQWKSFYWQEKTIDNWQSYIKEPHPKVVVQTADERNRNMDLYVLGKYGDVAAGNRVGTDYSTGDVAIDVAGAVTGNGTTFTAAMVGKGFKATGHTKWYRVKTYTSATEIVIENDEDDVTSTYDGGVIAGGTAYVIEAATVLTITAANLLDKVAALKLRLDKAEAEGKTSVPDQDRVLLVPPEFESILIKATGVALHVPAVYEELVKVGMITELQGFKVFKTNRLSGNNTDGFHILALHPNWQTFADTLLEAGIEEDLIGNFGTAYKDLFVYGSKVTDKRRHFAAELFAKF